ALKLPAQFRSRDVRGVCPLPLEEMDMAVPETGSDCEAGTIEQLSRLRNVHKRSAANRSDLPAIDHHDAVLYGILCRTDVNRSPYQSYRHSLFLYSSFRAVVGSILRALRAGR